MCYSGKCDGLLDLSCYEMSRLKLDASGMHPDPGGFAMTFGDLNLYARYKLNPYSPSQTRIERQVPLGIMLALGMVTITAESKIGRILVRSWSGAWG